MDQNLNTNLKEDLQWKDLCDRLFEALPSLSLYEESVRGNIIARLVGILPFLAKTERPIRDSLSNLSIFIFSYFSESRNLFRQNPMDDEKIFNRFQGMMCFTGGSSAIIDRGLSLIALSLLYSYKKNAGDDLIAERYNPLNSGCWNYSGLVEELTLRVEKTPCRKMDRIINLNSVHNVVWDY
jgi:hypothetical protein